MREVFTVCARDCYDTCSLIVTLDEADQIISIKGDPKHPFTQGFTCPRGAKDHERIAKNRIETPFLRQGNNFERIDWDSALDVVTDKLSETLETHGPEAVLYLDYAGNAGLLSEDFPQRLWNALGAIQTDHALCSKSGHQALGLHYGASYGITPEELHSVKLIAFWGFNAAVSSPHTWALAKKARQLNNANIIVIDPRKSRTAEQADLWIQPRPGSDVALAYGIINYLIQHQYADLDFIQGWTIGFDELKKEVRTWTLERTAQITGVPRKQIEQIGEAFHKLKPAATMIGIGLQKCGQGADQVRAVSFIPVLLGHPRGFFYSNSKAYLIDTDCISGESLTRKRSKIVEQVALADHVKQGQFKFIYVNGMNPVMTLPNQQVFREGISQKDVFIVVHDTHWSKTTMYADVALPAPTYLEKDDLLIPWTHNIVRHSPRIIPPVTNSRSEVLVMQELAKRLGLTEDWLYEDPWEAIKPAFKNAFEEGNFDSLRAEEILKLKRRSRIMYSTPSGKIEFSSSQAVNMGLTPLPKQVSLHREEGHFIYLTSASPRYTSTQFQEIYGNIPAIVLMNPQDAQQHHIEDGDVVLLSNDLGSVKVKAEISDSVPEGVLWSPRQFEGLDGAPQNCLMSSKPQEIGSGPRFNSTTVTITRC